MTRSRRRNTAEQQEAESIIQTSLNTYTPSEVGYEILNTLQRNQVIKEEIWIIQANNQQNVVNMRMNSTKLVDFEIEQRKSVANGKPWSDWLKLFARETSKREIVSTLKAFPLVSYNVFVHTLTWFTTGSSPVQDDQIDRIKQEKINLVEEERALLNEAIPKNAALIAALQNSAAAREEEAERQGQAERATHAARTSEAARRRRASSRAETTRNRQASRPTRAPRTRNRESAATRADAFNAARSVPRPIASRPSYQWRPDSPVPSVEDQFEQEAPDKERRRQ